MISFKSLLKYVLEGLLTGLAMYYFVGAENGYKNILIVASVAVVAYALLDNLLVSSENFTNNGSGLSNDGMAINPLPRVGGNLDGVTTEIQMVNRPMNDDDVDNLLPRRMGREDDPVTTTDKDSRPDHKISSVEFTTSIVKPVYYEDQIEPANVLELKEIDYVPNCSHKIQANDVS